MNQCVLVLIAPISVEQALVDWLLNYRRDIIFSTQHIQCYGMPQDELELSQQVVGHLPKTKFHIQLTHEDAKSIQQELQNNFHNTAIRYWIMPTLETGYIGDPQHDLCNPDQ
ncbi:DUF3240 family protein [Kaarinaea lacus]